MAKGKNAKKQDRKITYRADKVVLAEGTPLGDGSHAVMVTLVNNDRFREGGLHDTLEAAEKAAEAFIASL